MDTLHVASGAISNNFLKSFWFWLAMLEFILIILLILRLLSISKNNSFSKPGQQVIKESKGIEIDMSNIMNSIHGSANLYKELSRKCHPDRFVNTDYEKIAEKIFQEISENRRNYEKLIELKHKATTELNINFN